MPNQNTIIDALRNAGIPQDTPLVLTNPGGSNPWLFTLPATYASNGGQPVVLAVPTVAANGIEQAPLAGHNEPTASVWYADSNMFLVRAQGRVAPVAFAKTFNLYLFTGNGLPSGNAGAVGDQEVALLSATLPAAGKPAALSNWYLEAKCLWDSPSLTLNGVISGMIGGTAIAATGFSIYNPSAWAAQQAAGAYLPISFVIGVNMASTANNPSNDLVYLEEFSAEEL